MYYAIPASEKPEVNEEIIETIVAYIKDLDIPKGEYFHPAYIVQQDNVIFVRKITHYSESQVDGIVDLCEKLARKFDLQFK